MKKYKIALGSFIVSALFLASCQDIDLLPKDNLPDESFWKTPDDFEKECNWLYTRTPVQKHLERKIRIAILHTSCRKTRLVMVH